MTRSLETDAAVSEEARVQMTGDPAAAIDIAAIAAVSTAICVASDRLAFMTLLVPTVIVLRFAAWRSLPAAQRWASPPAEGVFFVLCTLVGAVNDWNSVVRHRVYDYDVPAELPSLTTIPFWMLLYWGMILRAAATLCRWHRLGSSEPPRNDVHFGRTVIESAALKVLVLVTLVVATRQLIYRFFGDPVLSWLPFAGALMMYVALLRPGRRGVALGILALLGCAIEGLYTHVGLHHYQLGWLGGVPLWIVLWWILAVWVWDDLSMRLQRIIAPQARRATGAPPGPALHIKSGQLGIVIPANAGIHAPAPPPSLDTRVRG
jgi:hypothetical protein